VNTLNTRTSCRRHRFLSQLMEALLVFAATTSHPAPTRHPPVRLLRNVDRCELLIVTDASLACSSAGSLLLLPEAVEQGTCVAFLGFSGSATPETGSAFVGRRTAIRCTPSGRLSPLVLSDLRRSFQIDPEGFGGSDGFGRAPTQASRAPLASRTVVLVARLVECLNARAAGMRAVAVPAHDGYVAPELEGVADAVVDRLDELRLDDLATPGGYWLNTMVPINPWGGPADPDSSVPLGVSVEAEQGHSDQRVWTSSTAEDDTRVVAVEDEDGEGAALRSILADLDQL